MNISKATDQELIDELTKREKARQVSMRLIGKHIAGGDYFKNNLFVIANQNSATAINLSNYERIIRGRNSFDNRKWHIRFIMNGGGTYDEWTFESEEMRDKAFHKLVNLASYE